MINFITNRMGWPSEFTRGLQMAKHLGCKVNEPIDTDDVVICIKCMLPDSIGTQLKRYYIDFIDDVNTSELCRRVPYAKVIVLTDAMKEYLETRVPNTIVVIPEHTCNFENDIRIRKEVTTVGYVGSKQCFFLDVDELTAKLKANGLDFKFLTCEDKTVTREDVCAFYKSIDIQVAFRPDANDCRPSVFRNPLKLINAGSFNIPTVAYPEFAYREAAKTSYIDAIDLDDAVHSCCILRNDKTLYDFMANRSYEFSQDYTIDKIAKLYKELDK